MSELKHHGILGMKWGVRRARDSKTGLVSRSEEHIKSREIAKIPLSAMTNAQLRQFNERMNLEQQYKNLSKKEISKGRRIAEELLVGLGKEAAKEIAKSYTKPLIEALKKGK